MAITKSNPSGSRATKLTQDTVDVNAISTQWNIVPTFDDEFTIVTSAFASTSGNVLDSGLSFIDLWLPPFHTYTVRTRHALDLGGFTSWTSRAEFASRGPLNSFEKYQALSGISGVDNVVT